MSETTGQTSNNIEKLSSLLDSGTMQQVSRMLNSLHLAEIAGILETLPLSKRKYVWELIDPKLEGEILVELGDQVRDTVIREMEPAEVVAAVENLDADDMADVILSLPEAVIRETLASLDKQRRQQVETVLSYPEDTAGGLMDTRVVTIRPDVTLDVVLRYLRNLGELPDNTDRLMVVDRHNHFLGSLRLEQILMHSPDTAVDDLMNREETIIPIDMKDRDVADLFQDRDLISAPVVGPNNRLMGRITIDDVVDVIVEEADKSVMNMAGLQEDEDIFAPIIKSARRRAVWHGVNLITAFIAAWVIGLFEATIQQVVALAVLMPIVASMGGIAGSQTLTLVIRGQALGHIVGSSIRSLLVKELAVGFLNGLLWAFVVAVIASWWFNSAPIGGIIAIALVVNFVAAALTGVFLPFVLRKMRIDPALAGSVILTTFTDVIGFFTFLGTASLILVK
ncbi:MAG TPA: magnesium transporter [Gammaproteobacteria bacterium]|nr:magnesium transporter [Gammaproteobacteria bacterium]